MTDQELRDYTSRLIAEKNYSDMMRRTRVPGKAREFVGEVLKNGTKTLAEAGFRKLASEMTKSKLERENDDLNTQVRNKELREKLEPKSKEGALSKAMSIINSPSSTASDIQEAKNILQNYSASKNFLNNILGNANNKAAAAEVAKDVDKSKVNPSGNSKSQESKANENDTRSSFELTLPVGPQTVYDRVFNSYTPPQENLLNRSSVPSEASRFSDFKMPSADRSYDLSTRSGASTRNISYDTSKRGDHSYLDSRNDITRSRFIEPSRHAVKQVISPSWEEEWENGRRRAAIENFIDPSWEEEWALRRRGY
jgi:hypothetical protein